MIANKSERDELRPSIIPDESIDGTNAHILLGKLLPLIERNSEIIIDLQNTRTITSKGLAALLDAAKVMGQRGRLQITNADDAIAELLQLTGLDRIILVERQGISTRQPR